MIFQQFFVPFCLVLFFNCSSSIYAHDYFPHDPVGPLLEQVKTSIVRVEDEKIVFHPEKTCFYDGNIYVEDKNGDFINFSSLSNQFSYNGFEFSLVKKQETREMLYICTKCNAGYFKRSDEPAPVSCENCGNTKFLIRYR